MKEIINLSDFALGSLDIKCRVASLNCVYVGRAKKAGLGSIDVCVSDYIKFPVMSAFAIRWMRAASFFGTTNGPAPMLRLAKAAAPAAAKAGAPAKAPPSKPTGKAAAKGKDAAAGCA